MEEKNDISDTSDFSKLEDLSDVNRQLQTTQSVDQSEFQLLTEDSQPTNQNSSQTQQAQDPSNPGTQNEGNTTSDFFKLSESQDQAQARDNNNTQNNDQNDDQYLASLNIIRRELQKLMQLDSSIENGAHFDVIKFKLDQI